MRARFLKGKYLPPPPERPLTTEELQALMDIDTLEGTDAVLDFIPRVSPGHLRPNHLRRLAALFPRAEQGPLRVCISSPPRHGKTDCLLHGAVWLLTRHPEKTIGYVTHNTHTARSKSKEARRIAAHAGLILAGDSKNANEWRTTAGGGWLAAGRETGWAGLGVDFFLLDDLVASRHEAESTLERDNIDDFFRSIALQRVEPGGSIIVNMVRWHPDDQIGRLVKEGWEFINIPVQDAQGVWLWPERWPAAEMEVKKRDTHEFEWSSQFLGQPRHRGGTLFHEDTVARFDANVTKQDAYWQGRGILMACDPAITQSTHADFSAIIVGTAKMRPDRLMEMDVLDVHCLQVELPELCRTLENIQRIWACPIVVESVGAFKGTAQTLRNTNHNLKIIEVTAHSSNLAPEVRGDKLVRAQPVAAAWNDGRVRVPFNTEALLHPWDPTPFLHEVGSFTGVHDSRDDQVDALAYLWSMMQRVLQVAKVRPGARAAPGLPFG